MASNHLEQLAAEWYEYQGYFVRRNVRVGPRAQGGHEGELDIVAFEPRKAVLVHIETSGDADSWAERERRFARKFLTGEKYIRNLFYGIPKKMPIEKIAIFAVGSRKNYQSVGDGKIKLLGEFVAEILAELENIPWTKSAVPEQYPLIRTLQIVSEFRESIFKGSSE
jgi:hypothetical protein